MPKHTVYNATGNVEELWLHNVFSTAVYTSLRQHARTEAQAGTGAFIGLVC